MTTDPTPGKQPSLKINPPRATPRSITRQIGLSPSGANKKVDHDTMVAMVRNAANAKLANADQTKDEMKEMRRIADIAEEIGDHETAEALRTTLDGLAAVAIG
jgi:hypothetical protein